MPDCLSPMPLAEQGLAIETLLAVVARLRHPETGCPWDLKQTHASLRPYMLEEAYEAVEAMAANAPSAALKEELGDVLLQVVLHAQLAAEAKAFTFDTICQTLTDKLVRRHPHVFGQASPLNSPEAVTAQWQQLKQQEKAAAQQLEAKLSVGQGPLASALDGVSDGQPALSRALQLSKKAVAVGFEWPTFDALWACVMSEFEELRQVLQEQMVQEPVLADGPAGLVADRNDRLEDELGDILFATVNLARQLNIHPEVALTRASNKFKVRFQTMEQLAEAPLNTLPFDQLDALWQEAKRQTIKASPSSSGQQQKEPTA